MTRWLGVIEVTQLFEHADAGAELVFGEGFEAFEAEFFDGKRGHGGSENNGAPQCGFPRYPRHFFAR